MEPLLLIFGLSLISTVVVIYRTRQREDESDYDYYQRCREPELPISFFTPSG